MKTNKTQYDWFPGKSQNSKKFHTKNRKIHSCIWELCVKNSQNSHFFAKKWPNFRLKWPRFRQIRIFQTYIVRFTQRRRQEQLPCHKFGRFIVAFGSYRPKTLKLALNGQILVLNGQNFAISEFSRHIEYDFLKEDHKNNFHTKIRKIHSGVWKGD